MKVPAMFALRTSAQNRSKARSVVRSAAPAEQHRRQRAFRKQLLPAQHCYDKADGIAEAVDKPAPWHVGQRALDQGERQERKAHRKPAASPDQTMAGAARASSDSPSLRTIS